MHRALVLQPERNVLLRRVEGEAPADVVDHDGERRAVQRGAGCEAQQMARVRLGLDQPARVPAVEVEGNVLSLPLLARGRIDVGVGDSMPVEPEEQTQIVGVRVLVAGDIRRETLHLRSDEGQRSRDANIEEHT